MAAAGLEPFPIVHVLVLVPTAQLTSLFNDKELLLQHLYLQYLPENITPLFMLQGFKHKLNVPINTLFSGFHFLVALSPTAK